MQKIIAAPFKSACKIMAVEEDQQNLQKCLDNLNKEMVANQEEDEDGNLVLTITTEIDGADNNDDEECKNGTIIMDVDGNYYFQTSDKIVEVKPIKKETPVKKVAATIITPSCKSKKTGNQLNLTTSTSSSSSVLKQPILQDNCKNMKKEVAEVETNDTVVTEILVTETEAAETIIPKSDEPVPSGIDENDDNVYEFNETEQDLDDPLNDKGEEYESIGLLKPIKKQAKPTADSTAIFNCMLCPYETNKKFLLSRHLKIHSDERPYKCSVCERGFKSNSSLLNHVNTHLGNKPHACKDCEKTFTTSGELVRHVRYRHTHIKPHKCTECDYSSVEMSKLRRHMRCHTGERPYQCPHCTYASPDTFKLKRHMRTHTGEKPYECDICQARFTQSNSLKYHRLIHSVNDKPVFQCHLCPTTCGRKTDLRLHIRKLHSSDQPLPCKRCGKELPDRYSYKMHIKTHEGEKCYRCTYCAYASITQRHLESHMLIHTDTKPFVCEFCNMTFRQKQLLTRHTKFYHTNNYQPPQPRKKDHRCPHCDRAFAFNGNLIRHMETHDPSSQMSIEKQKLRMGRLKRIQPDGSIVTVTNYKRTIFPETDGYMYEDEEQGDEEEGEIYEGEYEEEQQEAYEEEYEEYNGGPIQYIYQDFGEEYEGEQQEELLETKPNVDIEMEKLSMRSSLEQKAQMKTIAVKQENDGSQRMDMQPDDDQGFMIIEVMQDDEEEAIVENEHEPEESKHQVRHNIINNNYTNATVIETSSVNSTFINPKDCFGFEVDDEEDDDEETKGAIQLLQLIEQ